MSDFHCPLCHAEIDHLDYTEEGTYALNPDGSFDDRGGCVNVGRVSCPACHGKLDWSLEDDVPTVCGTWRIDESALREEVEEEVLGAGSAPGPDALSHFSADIDLTAEGWCERMEACMQDVCDKSLGR